MTSENRSITITYGDCAENHSGMQVIGKMADNGFSIEDLIECKLKFESEGVICKMINLNDYVEKNDMNNCDQASVLVIKDGVNHILKSIGKNADDMLKELDKQKWDTKAFMYGRVVNKKARHNICIADEKQEPDYPKGKGTIIPFKKLRCCDKLRNSFADYLKNSENLFAEGNLYYDNTCGIGWHGDSERRKVIAVKLGDVKPLNFHWYYRGKRVGTLCEIELEHADIYVMSEKTVGTDWKTKLIPTLRHSTGAAVFTK